MLKLAGPVLQTYNQLKMRTFLTLSLSVSIGLTSGLMVSLLFVSLDWVTALREASPGLIIGLPVAGVIIALLHRYQGGAPGRFHPTDTELLKASLHSDSDARCLPRWFAPQVLLSTCLTHLLGGSAGREGAATQISAGLTRLLPATFFADPDLRQGMLLCALASGFAAALGAPISGLVFAWEFSQRLRLGKRVPFLMILAVLSSLLATEWLGTKHLVFPKFQFGTSTSMASQVVLFSAISLLASLPFALLALALEWGMARMEQIRLQIRVRISDRMDGVYLGFFGGVILLLAFAVLDLVGLTARDYQGLGLRTLMLAFSAPLGIEMGREIGFEMPFLKLILTVLTLGAGFKGGEFVPLFFIGATCGSALARWIPFEGMSTLLPALGCVTVFGVARGSPGTALALSLELFGAKTLPFSMIALLSAQLIQKGFKGGQPKKPQVPDDILPKSRSG